MDLTVRVVVRRVMVVPDVLVRREVRGVLLQAWAAGDVAEPVAVGAVAAAARVRTAAPHAPHASHTAGAAEHC